MKRITIALAAIIFCCSVAATAQTSTFTYQGKLNEGTTAATGSFDFKFTLYSAATGGTIVGTTQTVFDVNVVNGVFTVNLDFGSVPAFRSGSDRYLQISVKRSTDTDYAELSPRQRITSAPYSVRSLIAGYADTAADAGSLGGIFPEQFLQTNGDGSQLIGLNASNISTGTLLDALLSSNIARRNATNIFTADQVLNGSLTQNGLMSTMNLISGFSTSGTFGSGAIPATGAGTRMMFYPRKAAFRAGVLDTGSANFWDDENVGTASVAMGNSTRATGNGSFSMGVFTRAGGQTSFAMGFFTDAPGDTAVAMGSNALASGSNSIALGAGVTASGSNSVSLGRSLIASGNSSMAIGDLASTNNQAGSFVYGDATGTSTSDRVNANAPNSWTIRASGGYRFFSNAALTSGVSLSPGGGAWATLSDRNAKDNFAAVNPRDVLRGVLGLPISTWNYKEQPQYRHIGAMAQDFYRTFNVGESDTTITTVDPDGVAFAAIQGLNEELKDRDVLIRQLQEQAARQQVLIEMLRKFVCEQNTAADICRQYGK